MAFPWISRSAHLETLAAKDETIAVLRETNAALLAAIPRATETPVEAAIPRKKKEGARSAIDYANLDPNDNEMLVRAALAEMGPGPRSASLLQRKVEHIRRQVIQSKAESLKQSQQPGVIYTREPETPEDVMARINAAVAQGQEDARVN
jgi:hypothetical protein